MDLLRLTDLANRYHRKNTDIMQDLPSLSIFRREAISGIEAMIYQPVICLILQGSKVTSIGDQCVELRPGDALLVSHDLPVVSRITRASVQEPYLAVILSLDLAVVRGLYEQISDAPTSNACARPLSAAPADPAWIAPLVRYFELMDDPLDARVLGPSVLREIHYRLLLCPIGAMLRHRLFSESHASRIARAVQKVRAEFRSSISISDLAKTAGMSASSFHEHFKSVTGTTPLQFQKELRLIEARALLLDRSQTVAETAYAVGYESPAHFTRDYTRKFGMPPSKDARAAHSADPNSIAVGA